MDQRYKVQQFGHIRYIGPFDLVPYPATPTVEEGWRDIVVAEFDVYSFDDRIESYRSTSLLYINADSEDQARRYALELVNHWNEEDCGGKVHLLSAAEEPM
jgi:hypothetical protein